VNNYIVDNELTPPEISVSLPELKENEQEQLSEEEELKYFHAMYLDMFKTGCEEIEARLLGK
jgi:hypothetical protein